MLLISFMPTIKCMSSSFLNVLFFKEDEISMQLFHLPNAESL